MWPTKLSNKFVTHKEIITFYFFLSFSILSFTFAFKALTSVINHITTNSKNIEVEAWKCARAQKFFEQLECIE